MTRSEYLAQFRPENRTQPARAWDNNHSDAIGALPPTDDVVMLGARILAQFEAECAELIGDSVSTVPRSEHIAQSREAIESHRRFYGDCAHLNVVAAMNINFIR